MRGFFLSLFDFAFSVAKVALKGKVSEIHLKKALHLEDEVCVCVCVCVGGWVGVVFVWRVWCVYVCICVCVCVRHYVRGCCVPG